MKYFSLFSGIGGFENGFPESWECAGYSENDKFASAIYRFHFPEHRAYGDATRIVSSEIPDFDILVSGFLCQSFSNAGKRQGFNDHRGTLFFEIVRLLRDRRPRHFLLENVKGLLSSKGGENFHTVLGVLAEIGYRVGWSVLNSSDFGVPQNRERVFIVGHLGNGCGPEIFPIGDGAIAGNGAVKDKTGENTYTITTRSGNNGRGSYIMVGERLRRLTPLESERLQGFPCNWTKHGINAKGKQIEISDYQRYKALGNAVTVPVVREIARRFERG